MARAYGTTALTALSTGRTSIPVTVIDGPSTALAEPAGAEERQPGLDLGELAELLVAVGGAGPGLALQPGDGDVAVLVVQRRERLQQCEQRVGCGAAELAAVLRAGERPQPRP